MSGLSPQSGQKRKLIRSRGAFSLSASTCPQPCSPAPTRWSN